MSGYQPRITFEQGRAIATRHHMTADFVASYRQIKPWWAFWITEHDAVLDSLADCDLELPDVLPPPKKP